MQIGPDRHYPFLPFDKIRRSTDSRVQESCQLVLTNPFGRVYVPWQTGSGHVNDQWPPSHSVTRFARFGLTSFDILSPLGWRVEWPIFKRLRRVNLEPVKTEGGYLTR